MKMTYTYDELKDNVQFYLVNAKQYAEAITSAACKTFYDMAIIYCVGSNIVQMENIDELGIMLTELDTWAKANTEKANPLTNRTFAEIFGLPDEVSMGMHIISTENGSMGARAIMYPSLNLREMGDTDLYIFPSSVHEVIVKAVEDRVADDDIKDMTALVNEEQVSERERLSNYVFKYMYLCQ